ncbi:hypothetical protein LXL04_010666 [Taraxacum kok-saghyz]
MLKHLKSLKLLDCLYLEELPENLGWLGNLKKLRLSSTGIRRLPDSIRMLIHLKSLRLESCGLLQKLPEDIGQLECLEKLKLAKCESLEDIPNSISNMKCLRYFDLRFCRRVEKLPEELGNLECLKELDIAFTGISRLPHNISSLNGLLKLVLGGSVKTAMAPPAVTTTLVTPKSNPPILRNPRTTGDCGLVVPISDLDLKPQGQLTLTIVKRNNLKNMEMIGKSDPYVTAYIPPLENFKIKVVDNNFSWAGVGAGVELVGIGLGAIGSRLSKESSWAGPLLEPVLLKRVVL